MENKNIEIKLYFENKRDFIKKTKYAHIKECKAHVWDDAEGLYLEVFYENEEGRFETIAYSSSLECTDENTKLMFKELKKLCRKLNGWLEDVTGEKIKIENEIVRV